MKKLLSILLAVALIVATVPMGIFTVSAESSGTTGDCTWTLDGSTLTISGNGKTGFYDSVYFPTPWSEYYNDITDVVVEEGVTGIGPYTFMKLKNLMNVTLPDSLLEVGDGAFSNCVNLESIVIPDTVTVFGSAVFASCTNLKNVSLPYRVESDLMGIFQHCENLKTVILPYGITEIGDFAFWNCPSLEIINMNTLNSATKIGWQAFDECTNLTQIILPKSITEIDKYAFAMCDNLTDVWYTGSELDRQNINIAEYNDSLDKATWHYVDDAGVTGDCIWYLEGETLTIFGNGDMDDYTGKESGLLGIDFAPWFFNCDTIKHAVIEDGVTNIGQGAFAFYFNLENVTIPASVTNIYDMAFVGCPALTINGHEGSYAQTYALEKNIPFVIIKDGNTGVASGDTNGDGSINNKDLGLLMQYLNNWDVEINVDAADVNDDGSVNNKDYGLLMQYLNNWDVELK